MNTQDVGKLIKNKRKEKNLNQKQLAELLHVSYTTVSKWETGINFPDIQNLMEISSVLDIALIEFLDENPPVPGSESAPDTPDSPNEIEPTTPEFLIPDLQNEPTEPEVSPPCHPSGKRKRLRIILPLLIVLFIAIGVGFWYAEVKSKVFSYTICNEYYGDYNGKNAYYIIAEYKGEITAEIIFENGDSFGVKYGSLFSDVDVIVIIYTNDHSSYQKSGFNDVTDRLNVLYPEILILPKIQIKDTENK